MASSAEIATANREAATRNAPRTEYVLRLKPSEDSSSDAPTGGQQRQRQQRPLLRNALLNSNVNGSTNRGGFLGGQNAIVVAWAGAMAIVSVDEWKANHILPRPSRLWWTTLTYALLCVMGAVDALTPLANALAIGYTIMLLWQYYNKSGQFS